VGIDVKEADLFAFVADLGLQFLQMVALHSMEARLMLAVH